jgi:hypothetical protein
MDGMVRLGKVGMMGAMMYVFVIICDIFYQFI